jgi:hypothetical protein
MLQPPKPLPTRNPHHFYLVTHGNSLILNAPARSATFVVS